MQKAPNLFAAAILFVSGLFFITIACGALSAPLPGHTSTALPLAPTVPPTQTSIPLYQQVALQSVPFEEQGQPFGYTITAQTPELVGSSDPRLKSFNDEMNAVVQQFIADFKTNLAQLQPTPVSAASTFDLKYNLLSPPGNILSLKFEIETYYTGAAHPGHVSKSVSYDLEQGHDLDLADLFVPDSDYLGALSKYCTAQLSTRDIGFQDFELGATATADNYRNWNITADGLMITFDEYQVAPYAAGPQTVVIPYQDLGALIQPNGLLAPYLH